MFRSSDLTISCGSTTLRSPEAIHQYPKQLGVSDLNRKNSILWNGSNTNRQPHDEPHEIDSISLLTRTLIEPATCNREYSWLKMETKFRTEM